MPTVSNGDGEWHQLAALSTNSHSADGIERTFHYDALGRTSMSLATGFDPYVYATEYDYDAADRITEITFPAVVGGASPVSVAFDHDKAGYHRAIGRVGSPDEPLWAAISANAPGQIMHELFGDETHVQRSYFPETLRPRSIWTHHDAGGPNLQSLRYSWTPAGELDYRNDQLHGQIESFEYDDARRLVEASANVGPAVLTQTVEYDAYGNIEYKSDVGAYGYDAGGRLTSYGPPLTTLGYDANGNVTTRGAQTLTYTPFEKVRTIEGGGASLSFLYDAAGERVVREDAANDTTDWTADVDDPTLVELGVGFTGHAAEPDAGLTNMGGRMYDGALGRFVQRGSIVNKAGHMADKSVGEVANLAAEGNAEAATAIKLIKQAKRIAETH